MKVLVIPDVHLKPWMFTRAAELLVIVGDEGIVYSMTQNARRSKRYSGLKIRLSDA